MREYMHPMFIAPWFTIVKIWKQSKCQSVDEWIKQLWYIYTMAYYLAIKTGENVTLCNSKDGPGEHYATWNKPIKERQLLYDITHTWSLINKMNYEAKHRLTESRLTAWGGVCLEGVEGLSRKKKKKQLMDTDNSVVIVGGRGGVVVKEGMVW